MNRQQCQQVSHGLCETCKSVVLRKSSHVHVYSQEGKTHELLCGHCNAVIAMAATPVVRAAASLDIPASVKALDRAFADGSILVLAQGRLA